MRISDWSSDVCSSDLAGSGGRQGRAGQGHRLAQPDQPGARNAPRPERNAVADPHRGQERQEGGGPAAWLRTKARAAPSRCAWARACAARRGRKNVVWGKGGSERVESGGRSINKKKN